jgi:hypothetical protein
MKADPSKWSKSSIYWNYTKVDKVGICSLALVFVLTCIATTLLGTTAWGKQIISSGSESLPSIQDDIKIDMISSRTVHAIAGQFIKVEGIITKLNQSTSSNETNRGGIAYISIVDVKDRVPVDLEDWSAEKGLYIPSIESGKSLPLEWNVRLVKSGSYTITILFNKDSAPYSPPVTSSKVSLDVAPKLNLNPGNILPVAFGVPAILIGIFGTLNYMRGRNVGVFR